MKNVRGTNAAKPTSEGGVWGSYVQYLKDLEAQIEDLQDRIAVYEAQASTEPKVPWSEVKKKAGLA